MAFSQIGRYIEIYFLILFVICFYKSIILWYLKAKESSENRSKDTEEDSSEASEVAV